jgi:hypothetical protein
MEVMSDAPAVTQYHSLETVDALANDGAVPRKNKNP